MTACHVEPRVSAPRCGLLPHRSVRRFRVHHRLAAYIGTRSARQSITVRPWPCPIITGPLALLAVGSMWGSIIGFALGGSVGAVFFLIGAIYGAPIGAIVGLVVGVPASIVLAALLLVRDRPATDIEQLARHVAGGLAALIELLAMSVFAAITIAVATGGDRSDLLGVAAAIGPLLLLSAAAAWLLRFAARDLVRTWARAWGRQVVR
jgi:hypothetical protein